MNIAKNSERSNAYFRLATLVRIGSNRASFFAKSRETRVIFSPPWNAPRPGWKTITQNSYILQVFPGADAKQSTESQSSMNNVKPGNCPQRSWQVKNETKSDFTIPVPVAGIVCVGLQSKWASGMTYAHCIHQPQSCCRCCRCSAIQIWHPVSQCQDPVLISNKTSYSKISWSLEFVRLTV